MKYKYLLFDLDGTLSDSKEGIVKGINHTLSMHGYATRDENELATFIGPQIDSTFKILVDSDSPELISELVSTYRARYSDIGYSENMLYDGIPELLSQLAAFPNITLGVCTSKRADFAERILKMFDIRHFFSFVSGGDIGIDKWQQLEGLLAEGQISHKALMIGDRYVDITAAQKNKLNTAGVLWGYGSHAELSEHKPDFLFSHPSEIAMLFSD